MSDKAYERRRKRRERIAEQYRNLVLDYMKTRQSGDIIKTGTLIHGVCMFRYALEMADPNGKWSRKCSKIWNECEDGNK